jgi:hypothetical protein
VKSGKPYDKYFFDLYLKADKPQKTKIDIMVDMFFEAETDLEALEIIFDEEDFANNPFLEEYRNELKNSI